MLCIGPAPVNKHIPALLGLGLDVFDIACAANHGDIEGQPIWRTPVEYERAATRVGTAGGAAGTGEDRIRCKCEYVPSSWACAANGHRRRAPPTNVTNSRRFSSGRDVHFMARPPPRSVRAAFPHTAPASGVCTAASCRIRSNACDTLILVSVSSTCFAGAYSPWPPPFAPPTPLRPPPQMPPQRSFLRFVRRLHCYYDEVRLLVSVHHRLRLLTFPMRTVPLTQHLTARSETSQVPMRSLCT